jgi:hypothetical protein
LRKSTGESLWGNRQGAGAIGQELLDFTQKHNQSKRNLTKWTTQKNFNFPLNQPVKRMTRKATDWEKVLVNYISENGLISRKVTQKSNKKKKHNSISKWAKTMNKINKSTDIE